MAALLRRANRLPRNSPVLNGVSKGLHRHETFKRAAAHCAQCQEIWTYMKGRDEEELRRIVEHLAAHVREELKLKLTA